MVTPRAGPCSSPCAVVPEFARDSDDVRVHEYSIPSCGRYVRDTALSNAASPAMLLNPLIHHTCPRMFSTHIGTHLVA